MYCRYLLPCLVAYGAVVTAVSRVHKRATVDPADFPSLSRCAQLSVGAYNDCQGQAFDVTITHQIDNTETNTNGYIGYSESHQTIAVVMRGSTEIQDFINDNDIALVTPTLSGVNFPNGTLIMHGVYNPWASVHDEVITEVKSLIAQYPNYTLETTGHSLGGSLTYMSYIALAQNFPGKSLESTALAAFAIGNDVFANFGSSQNGTVRRGNNQGDGIPNTYPQFQHYGTEYYSNGTAETNLKCVGELDTQCSAGNGEKGLTVGHLWSFGHFIFTPGCTGNTTL